MGEYTEDAVEDDTSRTHARLLGTGAEKQRLLEERAVLLKRLDEIRQQLKMIGEDDALPDLRKPSMKLKSGRIKSSNSLFDCCASSPVLEGDSEELVEPDFSGRWVLNRVEGDMEAIMVDAGVSWATRKKAKTFAWGAKMVYFVIS